MLVDLLKAKPRVDNLMDRMCECTLGVILETAMGIKCNVKSYDSDQFILDQDRFMELTTKRILNPLYHSDPIYKITSNGVILTGFPR